MAVDLISAVWPAWRIVEQIGEGSFGRVYKCVHAELDMEQYSAIKVISIPQSSAEIASLRSEGMDDVATKTYFQGIVNDFVNEIKLMGSMKGHPNVVAVEDFKVVEYQDRIGWDIYIRMELLTPFNEYMMGRTFTDNDAVKVGRDICSALELFEFKNIIHRDIKPENIFVSSFGTYKVGDFGIAKELGKTSGAFSSKGTYSYMAPEVAQGSVYNNSVDMYSLGIVLHKLLNNNRLPLMDPFAQNVQYNERKKAIDRRLSGEVLPAPVNASSALSQVILKACAYCPEDRYSGPKEFKQALNDAVSGRTVRKASADYFDPDATTGVRRSFDPNATTGVRRGVAANTAAQGERGNMTSGMGAYPNDFRTGGVNGYRQFNDGSNIASIDQVARTADSYDKSAFLKVLLIILLVIIVFSGVIFAVLFFNMNLTDSRYGLSDLANGMFSFP